MYIITVYGSCSEYLKDCLQVVQNNAARCVTGLPWRTPVRVLLLQCGWLSVRQLIMQHSMLLVFKIKTEGKPIYLHEKLCKPFTVETRFAANNAVKNTERIESELRKESFVPRSTAQWNNLPAKLRKMTDMREFKKELKTWIKQNVAN